MVRIVGGGVLGIVVGNEKDDEKKEGYTTFRLRSARSGGTIWCKWFSEMDTMEIFRKGLQYKCC